jgi:hypothetical protein
VAQGKHVIHEPEQVTHDEPGRIRSVANDDAESTIQQLGHGDYDMLFGHYRTLMTKEQAEKIFSLTPDMVSKG